MKVTDLRRKLMAALVAGGMLAPSAMYAADFATNLVVNGDFENVDLNTLSLYYSAPLILNWNGTHPGFAYSHDMSGNAVPDFANGNPLASGGHWYFTPGNSVIGSIDDALTQDIDVSAGPTASAIAAGTATFSLSAFFNTYDGQADRGFVKVDFLGTGSSNLGSATISSPVAPPLAQWTQFIARGLVPVGTQTVHMSSWGEVFVGSTGSADGYTDNIEFRISIAGDYNDNGVVDAADYAAWRNAGASDTLPNDPTPGIVDGSDYTTWKANFGKPTGAGAGSLSSFSATSVPEPSSVFLVGLGLASLSIGGRGPNRKRNP